MKRLLIYVFCLLCLPVAAQDDNHDFNVAKNLDVFNAIYKNLDMMYVDTLDADQVIGNGIKAMLNSLDPYTVYYPENKEEELKMMITGKYAGIGAVIRYDNSIKSVVIGEPYENMPAAEAGLRKGDQILSIDDTTMVGKSVDYVSSHLRGDPGTTFLLKYRRPGVKNPMKVKITRKSIQLPSVPYYGMLDNSLGYIRLTSFTEDCSKDVRRALLELKRQGMKGLVFDLRSNGGGSEQEAVNIVNMFIPKGKLVVSNRGKLRRVNKDYKTSVEPIDTVMPVAVLVNDETASASEITSGALQDMDRAVVVGTRTYGKGLVQMTLDLPYNGTMKLTTNKYYIPSGRCIQAINYKHSRGGKAEQVADSLTRVFHTANGREVKDGGGIMPDVEVKPDSMSNLVFYLTQANDSNETVLHYVTDYINSHPTIAPARNFTLSDADFEGFKQRVLKSGFTYDKMTGKYLGELEKLAKFEGYYDDAKDEFEALSKKLKHNLVHDIDFNKQNLKEILASDIVAAYYYQRGAIENSLAYDKQLKEACSVLLDQARYKKILGYEK